MGTGYLPQSEEDLYKTQDGDYLAGTAEVATMGYYMDEVVEAKFSWDDNKSFLIEEFQVIREEAVLMKGTQRIGWDPQAKQVRSWIFDNASGFGSSCSCTPLRSCATSSGVAASWVVAM